MRKLRMSIWLKLEFCLCVLFPICFCPFNYFVLHGTLVGSLYGLGLIPLFIMDYFQERKGKRVESEGL